MNSRSSNFSFTAALCVSLALHAAMFVVAEKQSARWGSSLTLGPTAPERAVTNEDLPAPSENDHGPLIVPVPPQLADPQMQLGRADGAGTAIDDSPGDEHLQARKGDQDQPLLSRDPAGPGKLHDEPSQSTLPQAQGGGAGAVGDPAPIADAPRELPPQESPPPVGLRAMAQATEAEPLEE